MDDKNETTGVRMHRNKYCRICGNELMELEVDICSICKRGKIVW